MRYSISRLRLSPMETCFMWQVQMEDIVRYRYRHIRYQMGICDLQVTARSSLPQQFITATFLLRYRWRNHILCRQSSGGLQLLPTGATHLQRQGDTAFFKVPADPITLAAIAFHYCPGIFCFLSCSCAAIFIHRQRYG